MNAARPHAEQHAVLITLGSNLDPARELPLAICGLSSLGSIGAVSSVWESDPVGDIHQPRFCNAAVLLQTDLPPLALKQRLRQLETEQGRVRDPRNKNGPRCIDLDLAIYGNLVSAELRIPDPDLSERNFLAVPLAEVAPLICHPVLGWTLQELADRLGGRDGLTARPEIRLGNSPDV